MWVEQDRKGVTRKNIQQAFTSPRGYLGLVSSRVHLDQASLRAYLGVPRHDPLMCDASFSLMYLLGIVPFSVQVLF